MTEKLIFAFMQICLIFINILVVRGILDLSDALIKVSRLGDILLASSSAIGYVSGILKSLCLPLFYIYQTKSGSIKESINKLIDYVAK
jgi:hypothetical protein